MLPHSAGDGLVVNDSTMRVLDGVVILRRELIADCLTDREIAARLRDGKLHRVRWRTRSGQRSGSDASWSAEAARSVPDLLGESRTS